MPDDTPLLVLCTCPEAGSANHLAHALVDERLAACVNQVPGLTSVYRWEGSVREEPEVLLLIKSSAARFPALRDRLGELHPYDVPEVIALEIRDGAPTWLAWLRQSLA